MRVRVLGGKKEVNMGCLWVSSSATVLCLKRKLALLYDMPVRQLKVSVDGRIPDEKDSISRLTNDHKLTVVFWVLCRGLGGALTGVYDGFFINRKTAS